MNTDNQPTAELLRDAFTYIQPCCVDGEPDAHTVWIKVGVQSFSIDGYQDTKEEAEWMRLMLGKAFLTMLNSVSPRSSSDATGALPLREKEAASESVKSAGQKAFCQCRDPIMRYVDGICVFCDRPARP